MSSTLACPSRTPATPPPQFDRVAVPYRWLEYLAFGQALVHCRNHYIPRLSGCRRALVLGDGDGRFLAQLFAAHPQLSADAVDLSPAMLELLRQRAHAAHPTASGRLHTSVADARAFTPDRTYDLVVSHFFLDCLAQAELEELTARLRPHLAPGALWLVSDFRLPRGMLHLPAYVLVRLLYFGFRILTGLRTTKLPDHARPLMSAGFHQTARHLTLGGILTTELWRLS